MIKILMLVSLLFVAGCANMPQDEYRRNWKIAAGTIVTVLVIGKIQDNRKGTPECIYSNPPLCSPQ